MKKKLLSIIICASLVAAMVFSLAACGNNAPAETAAATEGATEAPAGGDGGTLQMATNAEFPPYEYKEGDSFAGIDVEIAEKIAEKLGKELVINDVEFGSIIGGVQTGKYDMGMAGMTVTDERLQSVNFSNTYAEAVQVIVVNEGSDIKSVDDLEGKMIGVQADTTGDIYCCDDYGDENVTSFKTMADAIQALIAGKVDCCVIDNEPAKSYVATSDAKLTILDTEYVVEEYAICVAKENTELLDQINAALDELTKDGTVGEIISKYIPAE